MNLDTTITFELTTADGFGDDAVSTQYETAAAVEQQASLTRSLDADVDTTVLTAWIDPTADVYVTYGSRLLGLLAIYADEVYRVTGVKPGASLLTGEPDLVELTLSKVDQGNVS